MPLIIKVGVSRKVSQDYQSQGFNLDIQSELDPRVLDDTKQLADTTNHLFQLANDLLDQQVEQARATQVNGNGQHTFANGPSSPQSRAQSVSRPNTGTRSQNAQTYARPNNSNGPSNGRHNGGGSNGNNGRTERPITDAQKRAIEKLAGRFDTTGEAVAREDFDTSLDNLTIRQASDAIDRMKKSLEAQEGQGAAR